MLFVISRRFAVPTAQKFYVQSISGDETTYCSSQGSCPQFSFCCTSYLCLTKLYNALDSGIRKRFVLIDTKESVLGEAIVRPNCSVRMPVVWVVVKEVSSFSIARGCLFLYTQRENQARKAIDFLGTYPLS